MRTVRLLLIAMAAGLLAGIGTPIDEAGRTLAETEATSHRAKLEVFSFDGRGTIDDTETEQSLNFEAYSDSLNAFDDPNQGRTAEAEATQDTTVDLTAGVTVETSGTASASFGDGDPGDEFAPQAFAASEFSITLSVTDQPVEFSLAGTVEATSGPQNGDCAVVRIELAGEEIVVAAPVANNCGDSTGQQEIDVSGELPVGNHTIRVRASASVENANAAGAAGDASFDLTLNIGCGSSSGGGEEGDADGDNIPDEVEEDIGTDPSCNDTDGDGLLDPWEVEESVVGAGFDVNNDGNPDVARDVVFGPYNGECGTSFGPRGEPTDQNCGLVFPPDPLHKDIYVEMDWQDCLLGDCPELIVPTGVPFNNFGVPLDPSHHAPSMAGLLDVVNVFRDAPVSNPDEVDGIDLHILVDEAIRHTHNCDQGASAARPANFGTASQRSNLDVMDAKEMAFRYAWSGHSSIDDFAPGACPLPTFADVMIAGLGLAPLPYYDISPHGYAQPGGRDILVTLAITWICQLYTFDTGVFGGYQPPCFRIGTQDSSAILAPGLFEARIADKNGGAPTEVPIPMHVSLGISPSAGVRQIWGRAFMNLLGQSLGVPAGSVMNNPNQIGAAPPQSYASWTGLVYAPPSATAAATPQGGNGGFVPIFPDFSLAGEDGDGDGTAEGVDNCPGLANATQANLDLDNFGDECDFDDDSDGTPDAEDDTPNDTDDDGSDNTSDAEDDGDGVPDAEDNCPITPNEGQENIDGDAPGDVCDGDSDGDGQPDILETAVGSDPHAAEDLPEFLGIANTCGDGTDNDGDGQTDGADSGCRDNDGDTAPDSVDNCPGVAAINLLDSDNDGTGDLCETPGDERTWGDNNCSGTADPIDALLELRFDAGLSTNTGECPALGDAVDVGGESYDWGDVDCNGGVGPVDGLKLLRHDSGLSVSQEAGCPGIGTSVTVAPAAATLGPGGYPPMSPRTAQVSASRGIQSVHDSSFQMSTTVRTPVKRMD